MKVALSPAAEQWSYRKVIKAVSSARVHFAASDFGFAVPGKVAVGVAASDFNFDFDFPMSRWEGAREDGDPPPWWLNQQNMSAMGHIKSHCM